MSTVEPSFDELVLRQTCLPHGSFIQVRTAFSGGET